MPGTPVAAGIVMIRCKRVYEQPSRDDGRRVLVDRLWPRGISRKTACIDDWLKELAPSDQLRRWYGHDPARWDEFRHRYRLELVVKDPLLDQLLREASQGPITLLFAAKDAEHNNAVVLKEFLEEPKG